MSDTRPRLEPGPDHPITTTPYTGYVTVRHNGVEIAATHRALSLQESNYPAVLYVPLADVNGSLLNASDQHTYCPYKGEASYYDVTTNNETLPGVIWYYPDPYDAVAAIKDHVAFYADRVEISAS